MAVFTSLNHDELNSLAHAHQAGCVRRFEPVERGSINTNYRVWCDEGKFFVRLYETPGIAGVMYEWALMSHLRSAGVPVPRRMTARKENVVTMRGKLVALFEAAPGDMICQSGVALHHLETLGEQLARLHLAAAGFGWRRRGRFELIRLRMLWDRIPDSPELDDARQLVFARLNEPPVQLPHSAHGVIHGDLFRDNVLWDRDGQRLSALLDWESASDGPFVEDLATTVLAWCFGDHFEWSNARAFFAAYVSIRPLNVAEWTGLYGAFCDSAVRFLTTRVTDFHLAHPRDGSVLGPQKDFRRFVARLVELQNIGSPGLLARLRP